jgi:ABC transporter/Uncharacterised protein family (UPF0014)
LASAKIEVQEPGYAVGGVEILAGVEAGMQESEITAVVGPSGAGKSTLLRAINRLIEPSSGEVYLDGQPTRSLDSLELRRRVGMVFQIPEDIGIAVVRSFVQLAAIGYVLDFIFGLDNLGLVVLLLAGMVLFAAWTSARRAGDVPRAFLVAAVAVGVAALGVLLTLRIVPPRRGI